VQKVLLVTRQTIAISKGHNMKESTIAQLATLMATVALASSAVAQADSAGARLNITPTYRAPQLQALPPGGVGTPGFSSLLTGQELRSQWGTYPGYVWYGPYTNSSTAAITITLTTPPGDNHAEMGAYVNDIVVGNGTRSTTFVVPPGTTYKWFVKDGLVISASANQNGLTPASVGLPAASDYQSAVVTLGAYASCTFNQATNPTTYTYYYYSTRSDKSDRGGGNQVAGPAPANPGTCTDATPWGYGGAG
jgi:hypothetical protein